MNGKNVGEEPPERNKHLGTVYSPLATCPECGHENLDMTLKDDGTTEYTCQSCWKTFNELAMKSYKIQSLMQQIDESKETEKKLRDILNSVVGWCEYLPAHSIEEKREIDGIDLQSLKGDIERKLKKV
jgi:DNA-directed RNA polymerase subunit RPC12/RpoP